MSGFLLVAWGVATGLLVGPFLVHLLDWRGLHVETGSGRLLRRMFVR